ncbi:hypothetical protein LAZ67_5004528 [Cordylochernes scorpioides]|uniref:Mos1 transposase HTH domain-containing protein n=1 Tax=Cordylochernes scorpioides TaxID=51811 RepID=A0ABY6KL64_9ARAC|nr:hypothetical protein LAZ67_5004528 [Cordylochernes scorpioides]
MLDDENTTMQELEKEQDLVEQYERNFLLIEKKVAEYLNSKGNDQQGQGDVASIRSSPERSTSCKLPKIALEVFDGTSLEWLGWWSQFEAIHENPSLSEVDKFHYLIQAMKVGTRAERLVKSYPLTEANYPKVIEALRDRFGDKAKRNNLYEQKYTPVYSQKDDLMWVFIPIRKVGLSEKLLKRYFGPYKVTKKILEVTYQVEPVDPSPRSWKTKHSLYDKGVKKKGEIKMSLIKSGKLNIFTPGLWQTQASPLAWRPANFQKSHATTARAATIRSEVILPVLRFRYSCIKFCLKNGFKGAEIFWMLQTAYGDAVMSRRRVFEWYKRFKEGREETADNERSGRPSTSTTPEKVDKVLELVREDRQITVREVAEEAGISFGSTQSIIKDILGVRRVNAVLVPKDLTFDQKNVRKETASLNLEATTDDSELLKRVITGDETWIYGFDSDITQQAVALQK